MPIFCCRPCRWRIARSRTATCQAFRRERHGGIARRCQYHLGDAGRHNAGRRFALDKVPVSAQKENAAARLGKDQKQLIMHNYQRAIIGIADLLPF